MQIDRPTARRTLSHIELLSQLKNDTLEHLQISISYLISNKTTIFTIFFSWGVIFDQIVVNRYIQILPEGPRQGLEIQNLKTDL